VVEHGRRNDMMMMLTVMTLSGMTKSVMTVAWSSQRHGDDDHISDYLIRDGHISDASDVVVAMILLVIQSWVSMA
jgi:hypothetical protein